MPSPDNLNRYQDTHRIVVDVPFVFMRPATFTQLFPATKKEGIRIESRSMKDATPDIIEKLKEFGTISKRVKSVKDYVEQLASTRYFIILDTPHERFRGNALVEANAAGCLILAPNNLRSLNSHLIPKSNRYKDHKELFELLARLNQSEDLRNKMLKSQNDRIAKASYSTPKNAFDKILKIHAESEIPNIKLNTWKHRYFPIICTKIMPLFGVLRT